MSVSALLLSTKKFYSKFILCGGWKFSAVFMGDYQVSAVLDRPSNCCHSLPQLVANSLFIPQNKIYTQKLGEIKMAWWVKGMQYFLYKLKPHHGIQWNGLVYLVSEVGPLRLWRNQWSYTISADCNGSLRDKKFIKGFVSS